MVGDAGRQKNIIKTYSILEGFNGKKEKQRKIKGTRDFEGQIIT